MSGPLLRVQLPNKENTVMQVNEEWVMQEILKHICEKRQFDHRDYILTFENGKKKEEEIDLTLQFRQYDNLKQVTLQKLKRKSFLLPASSKNTSLRNQDQAAPSATPAPAPAEEPDGGKKRLGRMRSISASSKQPPAIERSETVPAHAQTMDASRGLGHGLGFGLDSSSEPSILTMSLSAKDLSERLKDPSLAAFMSATMAPKARDSDEISIISITAPDGSTHSVGDQAEPEENEQISLGDVTREKIVVDKKDNSKFMTLQRKQLRPRGNTVSAGSQKTESTVQPVVVKMVLPNGNQSAIRVSPETTMEDILRSFCEKKGIDFEHHTLTFQDENKKMDLDRPLSYFKLEEPIVLKVTPSSEKSYSAMFVSEGDRDVMVLSYVDSKLEVMAATEDKLIERVTDEQETDKRFMDTLLLTYRSFMTPRDFFDFLVDRFNSVPPENATDEELRYYNKWIDPVRNKVIIVLQAWTSQHWHDFVHDDNLKDSLLDFVEKVGKISQQNFESIEPIRDQATKQTRRQTGIKLVRMETSLQLGAAAGDSPLLHFKAKQVAEALCMLNSDLFNHIDGIEYLNQLWRSGTGDELECPNLLHLIERFNKESAWVATEICSTPDLGKRVALLKKFIDITKECQEKNNFFTMFAFLAGLNLTPVQRLKKTWAALPSSSKKLQEDLEKLCDPSKNMKNYREHQAQCQPPVLPFLAIFLKDLIFFNDGNPSRVNKLVNFDKLRSMHSRIMDITRLVETRYSFEAVPEVTAYIKSLRTEPLDKLIARISVEGFES